MISRLNFLLAVAMLTVLLFYFAGRFLLLKAVMGIDPTLAPYFTAAYGLGALMFTVLVLAKIYGAGVGQDRDPARADQFGSARA